jgi:hypothetical protein
MAKVASVGSDLIDVGLVSRAVILKLQDNHRGTNQYDYVGPASALPRKLVLEDDGRIPDVTQLVTKHLETMVPSALLRVACSFKSTRLMMKAKLASPVAFGHAEEGVDGAMPGARIGCWLQSVLPPRQAPKGKRPTPRVRFLPLWHGVNPLSAAGGYMIWMCEMLALPDPGIRSARTRVPLSAMRTTTWSMSWNGGGLR